MKMSSNTILITGATSGIGLALAERFLRSGNEVIICGRREALLQEINQKHPEIHVYACDVSKEAERIRLFEWATGRFPNLNVLINNAGIQRRIEMPPQETWQETAEEIEINLNAPIHLSFLFAPHLEKQANAALLIVSSGLAFVPIVIAPVYCATKAAIHSFTLSARYAFGKKGIEVIEIIPPPVATDLGGPGLHARATPLDEFIDATMSQLEQQKPEITYGLSAQRSRASREELDAIFAHMNSQ
jgi:uncharacterized oxidoreductase